MGGLSGMECCCTKGEFSYAENRYFVLPIYSMSKTWIDSATCWSVQTSGLYRDDVGSDVRH
jgi:hypothetical protein